MNVSQTPPLSLSVALVALIAVVSMFVSTTTASKLALLTLALSTYLYFNLKTTGVYRQLVVALFTVALLTPAITPGAGRLADGEVRIWNVFHYYLGAKYFNEFGYTDLYVAALTADRQGANYWTGCRDKGRL